VSSSEAFTLLTILEAQDRASEIYDKVDESLDKFGATASKTAETVKAAGESIDESLLQTASGADALDLAAARVNAARAKVAEMAEAQAEAEKELLDAQRAVTEGADDEAAAQARLVEASSALTAAQKDSALAAKAEADALKLQSDTAAAAAAKNAEAAAGQDAVNDATRESSINLGAMGKVAGITAIGMGIVGGLLVKAAGNFQDSTAHLQTDAGVTAANLGMVRAGILQVSTATGQSAESITDAMYHIASSGYTASNGLAILKTVAEGARVGGADLDTTSKALVGTLTAYYGSSMNAAQATKYSTSLMNQLIATVGSGDMRMSDLASSLSAVTPVAATAHLAFSQVGGAIATMTAQGMSARQSTQDLAFLIRSLSGPSASASAEMKALGLNANDVATNLGKRGLSGTLDLLSSAILKNTSGGSVLLGYMNEMTPATKALAQQILNGSITTEKLRQATYNLNPQQAKLISLFDSSATSATGLKQTYSQAMKTMTGGATGLNVALMLTGKHTQTLAANIATISKASKDASGNVNNWSTIQSTFNFKVAQARTGLANTGIAIGSALLPAATALMSMIVRIVAPIAEWTAKNKGLTEVLFVGVTAIAATIAVVAGAAKAYKMVSGTIKDLQGAYHSVMKLFGLAGDEQAAAAKKGAAASATAAEESAAAQEEGAAEGAAAQEAAAGEAAAAQDEAAGQSAAAWIASGARSAVAAVASSARTVAAWALAYTTQAVAAAGTAAEWVASAATSAGAWIASTATTIEAWGLAYATAAVQAAATAVEWVASAARTVAAWALAYTTQLVAGAAWMAETIARIAIVVATNVAGALATAAAWIAANAVLLLGIGLVIAAVVAAVVLIVTHWRQISAAVAEVWHDVLSFITGVVDDVVDFVKSHWMLLLGILTGPIGLAVALVFTYWRQIERFFASVISTIVGYVRAHWPLIEAIITGGLSLTIGAVIRYWSDIKNWFEDGVSFVIRLLTGLADDTASIGTNIVRGIWSGISGAAGWLMGQIKGFASSVLSSIGSAFGISSPSKYTTVHGLMLGYGVGQGFLQSLPRIMSAVKTVTGAVLAGTAGLGASGRLQGASLPASSPALAAIPAGSGGATQVVIDVHDNTVMSNSDIDKLVGKIGQRLNSQTLPAAGYKSR
jgi:hypothetical protein